MAPLSAMLAISFWTVVAVALDQSGGGGEERFALYAVTGLSSPHSAGVVGAVC